MFNFLNFIDGLVMFQYMSQHICSFIYTVKTYNLCTQQFSIFRVKNNFYSYRQSIRVVTCMGRSVDDGRNIIYSCIFQNFFRYPG